MSPAQKHVVAIGLSAAIVSVAEERPCVLVVKHPDDNGDALPFGPFDPLQHRTLEIGLRTWVAEQTRLDLGYTEQLYTFGDRGRHELNQGEGPRVVSVGYLALTRQSGASQDTLWRDWYRYFPWEDWRNEKPAIIAETIAPALRAFAKAAPDAGRAEMRRERARLCFGLEGMAWDEEKVLERYELLYEAGLTEESVRDGRANAQQNLPLGAQYGVRSPPDSRHRHRPAARQDEIPSGGFRIDAALLHALGIAEDRRSDFRDSPAQTKLPSLGRSAGIGGRHGQNVGTGARPAGGIVPLPPRSAARTALTGRTSWRASTQYRLIALALCREIEPRLTY